MRAKARFALPIAWLVAGSSALAHQNGHGPAINGVGPNGGPLVAIVSAKEAELGENATPEALAEWAIRGNKVSLALLTVDRKKPLALKSGDQLKWIFIGRGAEKPMVIQRQLLKSGHRISETFDPGLLEKSALLEVILPPFKQDGEKRVLAIALRSDAKAMAF